MPIRSAMARTTPSSMRFRVESTRATSPPARRAHTSMTATAANAMAIVHLPALSLPRDNRDVQDATHQHQEDDQRHAGERARTNCLEGASWRTGAYAEAEEHSRDRGRGDGSGCDAHYESIALHRTKQMSVPCALKSENIRRGWRASALANRESRLDSCRKA